MFPSGAAYHPYRLATIQAKIEVLNLTPEIEEATYRYLIPQCFFSVFFVHIPGG